jgi:phosphate transporter
MHQREHIAWERDTVWRQMIGQERRGEAANPGTVRAMGGTLVLEPEKGLLDMQTPAGRFKLTTKHIFLFISTLILVVLLNVRTIESEEANRCFAILVFATVMWATEAIPLFVTSIFIPLLLVTLRVIRDGDGKRLSAPDATK